MASLNLRALAAGTAVLLLVVQGTLQQQQASGKDGRDSCQGRCGDGIYDGEFDCYCNADCTDFGDCCSDYDATCLSCADRCDDDYDENQECQCNDECSDYGNCCEDYDDECDGGDGGDGGGGGDGEVTDAQLSELSELLLSLDFNNGNSDVDVDYQGETTDCSTSDQAPDPMFSRFEDSIYQKNTVALLLELYDNYDPYESNDDTPTDDELAEENAFMDAVFESAVMLNAYTFLYDNGVTTLSQAEFRDYAFELWFGRYSRGGSDSSSGFEHVFIGEVDGTGPDDTSAEIGGFHSWIHYHYEEERGNIDYLGWIVQADFGQYARGITNVHTWLNGFKCIGGFFIGTSPELDMAVKTVCALTRTNAECTMTYNGSPFKIQSYIQVDDGNDHIGSAYPIFE